jgi:hypothetical protein
LRNGAVGAVFSWSLTTLAVAAKNVMASVPDYVMIETAFTIVQWTLVAPFTVLSFQSRDVRGGAGATDGDPVAVP